MPELLFSTGRCGVGGDADRQLTFGPVVVELTHMQLFGTSGIRAIADRNLIYLAFKVGLAMGVVYDNVAVGGDTRSST